jgi:hypothetical protein
MVEKLSIAVIESAVNCASQLLAIDCSSSIAHAHSLARILTANLTMVEILNCESSPSDVPQAQYQYYMRRLRRTGAGLIEAERLAPSGPSQPGKGGANPGQRTHCTPVIISCNRFYDEMERKNFKLRPIAASLA